MKEAHEQATLISLLEECCKKYPTNTAVFDDYTSLTYREFTDITDSYCHQLENHYREANKKFISENSYEHNYKADLFDSKVGVLMDRSIEMVVAIFSILKTGAAYVPADPNWPESRINDLFSDAGVRLIVTTVEHNKVALTSKFDTVLIGESDINKKRELKHKHNLDQKSDIFLTNKLQESISKIIDNKSTAYVLFTSGSTGKPKGVEIQHSSVVNLINYIQRRYPIDSRDVIMFKSPYTFDGSVWEIFGWMEAGASLYVLEAGAEKDPEKLLMKVNQHHVSFMFFVPSMLKSFLDYYEVSDFINDPNHLQSLKWVSVGGEVLPVSLADKFYKLTNSKEPKLINVYGPTETTVYATTYLCPIEHNYSKTPIGYAVDGDEIYILDKDLKAVPFGQEGEIFIGGAGVGKGYINRPELNSQRFLPNPYRQGETIYRTGDIGKEIEPGIFDFCGREDFQVKLRGLRIELGEIEYELNKIEEIKDSLVIFTKDANGTDCIAAYVVYKPLEGIDDSDFYFLEKEDLVEILLKLRPRLPEYMIPSYFVNCKEFKLSENGKKDISKLQTITQLQSELNRFKINSQPSDCPSTSPNCESTGNYLLNIWVELTGGEPASEDVDFFEVGGNSIKAIQLIIEIKKRLNVKLKISDVYHNSKFLQLLTLINKVSIEGVDQFEMQKMQSNIENDLIPATAQQRQMWIMDSFDQSGIINNIQIEFKFTKTKSDFDIREVVNLFQKAINESEAFKITFKQIDGLVFQVLNNQYTCDHITINDIRNLDDHQKLQIIKNEAKENGKTRFNLSESPLFACRYLLTSDNELIILMCIHHIIFDGWSLNLFMERIKQEVKSDYLDIIREPKNLSQSDLKTLHSFWRESLAEIPEKLNLKRASSGDNLFSNSTNNQITPTEDNRFWWEISKNESNKIDLFCKEQKITQFNLFLAAFQLCLYRLTGQNKIVTGTPYANRENPEIAEKIGYCTNMIPLANEIVRDQKITDVLSTISNKSFEAFSHAELPFSEILRISGREAKPGVNPLYDNIFVLQNWPHSTIQNQNFSIQQKEIGNNTSKTSILLNIEKCDDKYVCWIEYDIAKCGLVNAQNISQLMTAYISDFLKFPAQTIQETLNKQLDIDYNKIKLPFSCLIIGEGIIVQESIKILERHSFSVVGIISEDVDIQSYAINNGIEIFDYKQDESKIPYADYLFSVNNPKILNSKLLSKIKYNSINYHDSILPKNAGVNATSWAIINGDATAGVTWHLINVQIDRGDILIQKEYPIKQDETAYHLNSQNFNLALESLNELLVMLSSSVENCINKIVSDKKQKDNNLVKSSYNGLHKKPENFGFLNELSDFEYAKRIIRACYNGPTASNEFCTAKLLRDNKIEYINNSENISENEIINSDSLPDSLKKFIKSDDLKSIIKAEKEIVSKLRNSDVKEWPFVISGAKYSDSIKFELSKVNTEDILNWMQSLFLNTYNSEEKEFRKIESLLPIITPFSKNLHEISYGLTCEIVPYFHNEDYKRDIILDDIFIRYPQLIKLSKQLKTAGYSISLFKPTSSDTEESSYIQNACRKIFIYQEGIKLVVEVYTCDQTADYLTYYLDQSINHRATTIIQSDCKSKINDEFQLVNSNKVAVIDAKDGTKYTYSELNEAIEEFTKTLAESGVTSGQRIAVEAYRSFNYVVAIFSILKLKATFVPLSSGIIDEERDYIINNSSVVAYVNTKDTLGVLVANSDDKSRYPDDEAYIIYTSGTTGKPKGVIIGREALLNFIDGATSFYNFTSNDIVLQFSNLAFDASIEEIFCTLISGATLVLRTDEMLSPQVLSDHVTKYNISVLDLPTAYWRTLLEGDCLVQMADCLRLIIIGGEAMNNDDLAKWNHLMIKCSTINSNLKLANTYGPTETTVVSHAAYIKENHSVSIGRPLKGYTSKILDNNLKPVYPGMKGELYTGGKSVAKGYCNNNELTALNFITLESNQKFYKTGDLVASDIEGNLYYLGRNDGQFKIRGHRVEKADVEHRLKRVEGVKDCVVLPYKDNDSVSLIAFVLTNFGQDNYNDFEKSLRTESQKYLQNHQIPQYFYVLDNLPLNRNGKTDNQALISLHQSKVEKRQLEPESETDLHKMDNYLENSFEEYILHVWRDVLNNHQLTVNDNFFDFGGNSIKAVIMVSKIHSEKSIRVPVSALINYPTAREFTKYISSDITKTGCLVTIRREGEKIPLFVIHGAGLNVLLFRSLSEDMAPGRPIYALQAKGIDGTEQISTSIEEMADDYIKEIKAIRPCGPYYLLGFSVGGFIAFDIASKLTKLGDEIGFLGMIDTVAGLAGGHNPSVMIKFCYNVQLLIKSVLKLDFLTVKTKIKNYKLTVEYIAQKTGVIKGHDTEITFKNGIPQFEGTNVMIAMHKALLNYKLEAANVQIDLFKAAERTFYISDKANYGWSEYARCGVNPHVLPGKHSEIFYQKNSKTFASQLDKILIERDDKSANNFEN